MLKLWKRTGEAVWLELGLALAMHGAGQVERHRVEYRQGRHSLWTGDLGLACLLWNSVEESDVRVSLRPGLQHSRSCP